jgi:hypothetical protein
MKTRKKKNECGYRKDRVVVWSNINKHWSTGFDGFLKQKKINVIKGGLCLFSVFKDQSMGCS